MYRQRLTKLMLLDIVTFEVTFPLYGLLWWLLWGLIGLFLGRLLGLPPLSLQPYHYVGLILIAVGFILRFWCAFLFKTIGEGRLLGWKGWAERLHVSKRLVTDGPYRHTRNPTYLAALTLNSGIGVFFQSTLVLFFTPILAIVFQLVVAYYEERGLEARFGREYTAYKKRVPRWCHRLTKTR